MSLCHGANTKSVGEAREEAHLARHTARDKQQAQPAHRNTFVSVYCLLEHLFLPWQK